MAENPDKTISVSGLNKTYHLYEQPLDRLKEALLPGKRCFHRDFRALDNIAFEVSKGETIGVIGENGSGKSTLLKIIAGVLTPTSGRVQVKGRVSALLELGAAFNPELTGVENIFLSGTIMGFSKAEMKKNLDQIIDFADIGEHISQPVKTYSSGMYVRLAFAIATIVEPEVLIVDEALSVGDMFFQTKCMNKMKALMERGTTTLFVSHDLVAVKSLCSRCIYLEHGKIKAIGPSGEVTDLYADDQHERVGSLKSHLSSDLNGINDHGEISWVGDQQSFLKYASLSRKGSKKVEVIMAELLDSTGRVAKETHYGEQLRLKLYLKAKESCTGVVAAFYVRDKNHLEVIGTNSLYEKTEIEFGSAEDLQCLEFGFQNWLKQGDYTIQLVVADDLQSSEYFDWIDTAIGFKVYDSPGRRSWALVNPPVHCVVRTLSGQV